MLTHEQMSDVINQLPVGQSFTFPPNTPRDVCRSFQFRFSDRRFRISSFALALLSSTDKPMRLTQITRTA